MFSLQLSNIRQTLNSDSEKWLLYYIVTQIFIEFVILDYS